MKTEEYLELMTQQIRCKKARPAIREEILQHIEDQTLAFQENGMEKEAARDAAVCEMGDPIEAGVALDSVHRPKMAWGLIFWIGILDICGLVVQYLMQRQVEGASFILPGSEIKCLIFHLFGFAIMIICCLADYSRIGKWAKELTIALFLILFVNQNAFSMTINSESGYVSSPFFLLNFNLKLIALLFIPLYGAILYHYRGQGIFAIIKNILWMAPGLIISVLCKSTGMAFLIFFAYMVILSIAVWKNWFSVSKKITLGILWLCTIVSPVIITIYIFNFGAEYQKERMEWLLNPEGQRYIWPGTDYLLYYVKVCYGLLAMCLIVGCIAFLFYRLLRISMKQKNQLGMMMGAGCSATFLLELIFYVLDNFCLLPMSGIYCPFLSYGGSGMVINYILLGCLLSVYRYKDVLPEKTEVDKRWKLRLRVSAYPEK